MYIAGVNCSLSRDMYDQQQSIIEQLVATTMSNLIESYSQKQELRLLGYLTLIEELMNETEKKGVGELLCHSSLVNTESVRIKVVN